MGNLITVSVLVNVPVEKVWTAMTEPAHILKWNHASDDWHTTKATNDLQTGGKFSYRMEAKDGSFGFDLEGIYDHIVLFQSIAYKLADNRTVNLTFTQKENQTEVAEVFEAESENEEGLQRQGWQMILNNFKRYTEEL